MLPGVIFPQTEIGVSPSDLRQYAMAVEDMGYANLLAYDHVVGVDRTRRPDFQGPFDSKHVFHDAFTLFAYLAGCTERIRFFTGVLVLPQRQTALVAKQAAAVDVLSSGRLTLGAGVGWNRAEYDAMGIPFKTRGRRFEQQVALLRELWTKESVESDFDGELLEHAGINPMPVQQPIPIWLGTSAPALLDRVARIGDGWIPFDTDPKVAAPQISDLRTALASHGRDSDSFPIEGNLILREWERERWADTIADWQRAGATQVSVATTGLGATTLNDHLAILEQVRGLFPSEKEGDQQ
ncbi:LLM class F420-dependent oxidoreductase [Nocardioides sp.]|uniref:LLM class F420-dependent oxidoreductase n=1 Tax=Nocardioides sp. TaxID=35761 RepID=UPI003D09596D